MKLFAVGVGPGDPELLTLKGRRLIAEADVIFAPTGRSDESSLALDIASPFIDRDRQEVVLLRFPITSAGRVLDDTWLAHADEVACRLSGGKTGVLLVEGDPSFYGSFNHLRRALHERHPGVEVEAVPGVPSPMAAAAAAGITLATRADRIAMLPSTDAHLAETLEDFETVVVLKASADIDSVLDTLEATGRTGDAMWVKRATMPDQQIEQDVRKLRGTRPDYFSMVIVRNDGRT